MVRKKVIVEPEHIAQRKVVQYLRSRGIGVFSVPNGAILGGKNKWGALSKLRSEGLLPGAPDLICMRQALVDGKFKPVAIEMKRKGGKLAADQSQVLAQLLQDGWCVIVGFGSDDAIEQIDELTF